jgi:hypothetical protein
MMEYEEFDVDEVRAETALAILCVIGGDEIWIPKSVIAEPLEKGDSGTIEVKTWWAEKEM